MKPNTKVIIIVSITIIVAILAIKKNETDPFYDTNQTTTAILLNKFHSTGKMGGSYTMRLKMETGEITHQPISPNDDYYQVGDKVVLRIYKRKKSGAIRYSVK